MKEELIRITFETPQTTISAEEQSARQHLHDAITQAIERFQAAFPKTDVVDVEMYPCDENCEECKAAFSAQ